MKKRILSSSLLLLLLVSLAFSAALPAFAVSTAEFEAVYQWNLSIFNTRSTDEDALKSFVKPLPRMPSDNPDIVELAESITQGKNSDYNKAKAIHDWVATNIWYDMDLAKEVESGKGYSLYDFVGQKAAILNVLESKRGVCGHYTYLTVTLLRAIGIPAIVADGYSDAGNSVSLKMYYDFISEKDNYAIHDWCEAYVGGRWIIMDVTWDTANIYQNGRYSSQRSNYNDYFDVSIRDFSRDHVYMMAYDEFVKDVEIPEGAASVFPSAFARCTRLENVVFPESLTSIGEDSFLNCIRLERIVLPDNVESIGETAFYNCNALAVVVLPENLARIGKTAFSFCNSLEFISIPSGIRSIEDSVFLQCVSMKRVVLPEGLETIGSYSFGFCMGMRTISLPDSVTSIGPNAFSHCNRLTSVILPNNTRTLGSGAFSTCNGLVIVYLPDGLVSIEKDTFRQCARLESVIIPASVTEIDPGAFSGCPKLTIYGESGTFAETYAIENNISFIAGSPLDTAATWARDRITEAVGKGFVQGELQSNYSKVITRAEFCRMAINWVEYVSGNDIDTILSERGLSRNQDAFTDTRDPFILAAFALGITSGTGNNEFSPDGEFSREQAATMIMNACRAIGADTGSSPASGFADLDMASEWARVGIDFAFANGVMQGTGNGNFSPKSTFTREQSIVTFNNIDYNALPGLNP